MFVHQEVLDPRTTKCIVIALFQNDVKLKQISFCSTEDILPVRKLNVFNNGNLNNSGEISY